MEKQWRDVLKHVEREGKQYNFHPTKEEKLEKSRKQEVEQIFSAVLAKKQEVRLFL